MYHEGQGVIQDYKKAVKWISAAVKQGDSAEQTNFCDLYYQEHGVAKNYNEAARWYSLVANQGYIEAQSSLGWMCKQGSGSRSQKDEVEKQMTPKQIEEAKKLARESMESLK